MRTLSEIFENPQRPGSVEEIEGGTIYNNTTVEDLVVAGRYDLQPGYATTHISSETVQIAQRGHSRLFVFYPKQEIQRINLEKHIQALSAQQFGLDHFEAASTPNLLIAGAFNPHLQLFFPIIAIGRPIPVGENHMVPCLGNVGKKRSLSIFHNYGPFSPWNRFLLVGCA